MTPEICSRGVECIQFVAASVAVGTTATESVVTNPTFHQVSSKERNSYSCVLSLMFSYLFSSKSHH